MTIARTLLAITALLNIVGDVTPAVAQAHPDPPVIFLHYDYMGQTPAWVGYSYDLAPSPKGIDLVVDAFRREGIQVVIDPRHTAIPYHAILSFDGCGPWWEGQDCVNFFDLKAQYFHPKGNQPWHYAIFGDVGVEGPYIYGGFSELPGYNFMITDGPDPERYPDLLGYQCLYYGFDWCVAIQAGLFMHELGHNLNLRHGGFEDQNFKPNYISVMNYADQSGIYFAAVPGSTVPAGIRADYSHAALPTLDPNHLDERVGLGGPAQGTNMQTYYGCTASPCYGGNIVYGFVPEASGPIDWNQDGAIETDEAVELNLLWWEDFYAGHFYPGTPMQGFDDWSAVRAFINAPPYKTGALPRGQGVPEPSNRPRPAR